MIHAYLFLTSKDRDRDGHGPNFLAHMKRINAAAGTTISVYHSFHDEVDVHRLHWWKCDVRCPVDAAPAAHFTVCFACCIWGHICTC